MRSERSCGLWFSPRRVQPGIEFPLGDMGPFWPKERASITYCADAVPATRRQARGAAEKWESMVKMRM